MCSDENFIDVMQLFACHAFRAFNMKYIHHVDFLFGEYVFLLQCDGHAYVLSHALVYVFRKEE